MKEEYADLFAEQEALFKELEEAETENAKAVVQENLGKVIRKTSVLFKESAEKFSAKMKDKLNAKLTAEQKAKLAQIVQDTPDYLKKMLARQQAAVDENDISTAWRPGVNSWMPGQGVPQDRTGHPSEARPERKPKTRPFPG